MEGITGAPLVVPAKFSQVKQALTCETPEITFDGDALVHATLNGTDWCAVPEVLRVKAGGVAGEDRGALVERFIQLHTHTHTHTHTHVASSCVPRTRRQDGISTQPLPPTPKKHIFIFSSSCIKNVCLWVCGLHR